MGLTLRVARIFVIAAAVAAPAIAFGNEKVVHLDVDGHVRPVRTYATSAPDLLRRVGVRTARRDVVRADGPLAPGSVVMVRSAKPVNLVLDGALRTVWVHGLSVGEALSELGMSPDDHDFVWPAPSAPLVNGMQMVVRNAVHVTVSVDGRKRDVLSNAGTVADVLHQAGIRLGPSDRVAPALTTYPTADMHVRITRVREIIEAKRVQIPFTHREVRDPKLEKGLRRVRQQGAEGVKVRRYATVLNNGKPIARRLLDEKVARKPRDEIMAIGSGQPAFHGGGHAQEGLASWYHFAGLGAAHRSLPIGTVVRVTNLANGRTVNVVIRDRGPFVDGRIIDLSDTAFAEIAPLGTGTARIKIEW
jgi:uncharacterized protein YabE (DUF348 family)